MTTKRRQCRWKGQSGAEYVYTVYEIGTNWNDVAGNYIFAKETSPRNREPIYIGETESFKDRLPNHNELPCVRSNGGQRFAERTQDSLC